MNNSKIQEVATLLSQSKYAVAFTGAGISVESGIPPFRGADGIYNKYDPSALDIDYFYSNTAKSWEVIKEIFYDIFEKKIPNPGHQTLAKWEKEGLLKALITQNIDNLHQDAGTKNIFEFHGNSGRFICMKCHSSYKSKDIQMTKEPPRCPKCNGLLKPDFIFFGEGIPVNAYEGSVDAANKCDLMFIIGSSGEVSPANTIPVLAKKHGAKIIEINKEESLYTQKISDIVLQGKAGEILPQIDAFLQKK